MVSSASQASTVEAPEQVIDFNTFYNQYGRHKYGSHWVDAAPDHWATSFANFFTGDLSRAKREYDAYLTNVNNRNEAKAVQSARAWDEYMSSTAYSRAFKDIEKAGYNPYLLLNSGGVPSSQVGSSSKASYSTPGTKDAKSDSKGRDLALIMLAIARLAAAFL